MKAPQVSPLIALTDFARACYKPHRLLILAHCPERTMADSKKPDPKKPDTKKPDPGKADLNKSFEDAAKKALNLKERPDNDTMLKLYALYKQGASGDVTGEKPGFFDFVGVAKYEAWAKLKGTAQETAKKQYVDLVKKLAG
jgi:acyl-CoA-binding protein